MGKRKLWRPPPSRPYTPRQASVTSAMMSAVRGRDNKAESALRKELWRRGLRYRRYSPKLVGKPDIVFASARVVVFVDGDFWHGRALRENGEEAFRATMRTERRDWWVTKLQRNVDRDAEVANALKADGWLVLRFWETAVNADVHAVANKVERAVRTRQAPTR